MNEWNWIEFSDFTKLGDRGVEKKECKYEIGVQNKSYDLFHMNLHSRVLWN